MTQPDIQLSNEIVRKLLAFAAIIDPKSNSAENERHMALAKLLKMLDEQGLSLSDVFEIAFKQADNPLAELINASLYEQVKKLTIALDVMSERKAELNEQLVGLRRQLGRMKQEIEDISGKLAIERARNDVLQKSFDVVSAAQPSFDLQAILAEYYGFNPKVKPRGLADFGVAFDDPVSLSDVVNRIFKDAEFIGNISAVIGEIGAQFEQFGSRFEMTMQDIPNFNHSGPARLIEVVTGQGDDVQQYGVFVSQHFGIYLGKGFKAALLQDAFQANDVSLILDSADKMQSVDDIFDVLLMDGLVMAMAKSGDVAGYLEKMTRRPIVKIADDTSRFVARALRLAA